MGNYGCGMHVFDQSSFEKEKQTKNKATYPVHRP